MIHSLVHNDYDPFKGHYPGGLRCLVLEFPGKGGEGGREKWTKKWTFFKRKVYFRE